MKKVPATDYLVRLAAKRGKVDADILTWELLEALNEKRESAAPLSAGEQRTLDLCTVRHCDGIEEILFTNRNAIAVSAQFADQSGFTETARILADVLQDKPVAGPVSVTVKVNGVETSVPLPACRWGATDLALSFADTALDDAILDFAMVKAGSFALETPGAVATKDNIADRITALATSESAIAIIESMLLHRKPRIRAQIRSDERTGGDDDCIEISVVHRSGNPAPSALLVKLRKQYGNAADALLDIYAKYDGLELFATQDETAFHFLPIAVWREHHEDVMRWCAEVTWQDAPDEIPDYLHTAIPFGYTPGDSERWLLITEGQHAGKVMLSDTDSIEDEARFESIACFAAALMLDVDGTVGVGGLVSYEKDGSSGGSYYPQHYAFEA